MPENQRPGNFTRRIFYLLGFLFLCRVVLMFVMPIIEPSECRYAAMARNMAESGDYLVPRFVHEGVLQSFDGKPPLFFQAAALSCRAFGFNDFAVRLPSLVSAFIILGMLYFTARRRVGKDMALTAVLFCAISALFYVFSALSLTDTVLAVGICGALFAYMLFLDAGTRNMKRLYSIAFFAFLGFGMVAKGPVGVLMAGMPIFIYTLYASAWRELRFHSWIIGPLVFLAIAAPWYVMMAQRDPGFLEYFFINENIKRFLVSDYGDRYGSGRESFRGMSLIWFAVANMPLLLLLFDRTFRRRAVKINEYAFDSVTGLAFSAFASTALFWCLTSRVPIYYLLPTVPMFSLWGAVMLEKSDFLRRFGIGKFMTAAWIWGMLLVAGLSIASFMFIYHSEKSPRGVMAMVEEAQASGRLPEGPYCFIGRTPYSAEYYAGRDVINHPLELPEVTLARSAEAFIVVHEFDMPFVKPNNLLSGREEVACQGQWTVYGPLKK